MIYNDPVDAIYVIPTKMQMRMMQTTRGKLKMSKLEWKVSTCALSTVE